MRYKLNKLNMAIFIGLLIVVGIGLFLILSGADKQIFNNKLFNLRQYLIMIRPSVKQPEDKLTSPTFTPSPSSLPSPSPETPLTGFCLNVPVIFYHHIEPLDQGEKEGHKSLTVNVNYFESDMKYLIDHGYTSIKAEDLVNALINHQHLPGRPIVVSLDDGYTDAYQYAYPIARKYNISLNLMIPTGLIENSGYLTWNQLQEMVGSGLVSAYNHTWSHYPLAAGSESKIEKELTTAKKQLEDHFGRAANILTYPNGSFNQGVVNVALRNGFVGAFSIIPGKVQCDSFIMALHRTRIGNAPLSSYGL